MYYGSECINNLIFLFLLVIQVELPPKGVQSGLSVVLIGLCVASTWLDGISTLIPVVGLAPISIRTCLWEYCRLPNRDAYHHKRNQNWFAHSFGWWWCSARSNHHDRKMVSWGGQEEIWRPLCCLLVEQELAEFTLQSSRGGLIWLYVLKQEK